MDDPTVARLRDVGFSLYEARLYVALLRGGAQNGNEVAKLANVPSSKVYTALDKLASEGVVELVQQGSTTRFTAVPPEQLVARLRARYNDPLDFLAEELPRVETVQPQEPFLTVSGREATLEAATAIVDAARSEVHLSCWQEELGAIRGSFDAAHDRGLRVYGMLYGVGDLPPGSWLAHHYEDIVAERIGGRLLVLVGDDSEALIALIPRVGAATAVRSRNPVMAMIVQEYLHHDNILQRAQSRIGLEEWDRWWQADPDARAEILGEALRNPPKRRRQRRAPATSAGARG